MSGISWSAAHLSPGVQARTGGVERDGTGTRRAGGGSSGDIQTRMQHARSVVAEGAAALQARRALGIPLPGSAGVNAAALRGSVVMGGGPVVGGGTGRSGRASVDDAICGCAHREPAQAYAPRSYSEPAASDVLDAPATFGDDPIAQDAPIRDIPQDDARPVEDAPPADAPPDESAPAASAPAESEPAESAPAPVAALPVPASSDGSEMPADAAPHDTTRREGEPNPVFYGDAPTDIPLPPAPGATGTGERSDPDPDAELPPGEIDASAPAPAPARATDDAAPAAADDAPAPAEAATPAEPEPEPAPVRPLGELTPNQFTDGKALTQSEGQAACGPAAAVAFARFVGKDLSLDHVAGVAREVGWDTSGMKGPGTQVQLLDKLGVKAKLEASVNWDKVRETVQSGTPVIIDTPGHYWVAEGFNPADGRFNFANSGAVYGDRSKTWYTPEEMTPNSGAPRSAIFLEE